MFNYFLYKIGQFIALIFPVKISYKIAIFLSDLHYLFAYADRKAVKGNLKAIFPEKPDKEIHRLRRNMFRNFAKYLVDFFRFSEINIQYIEKNVKVENISNVDKALLRGKGVITLTAHLGNWELGGVVIALLGYSFWAVALPHKNKQVDIFFNSQRESKGVNVIPLGRAVRQCLSVLKENKVLALVGDRDFAGKGIVLDFFGRPSFFPEGPSAFSLKTGATIVPGFLIRNNDDSFTLKFEEPIEEPLLRGNSYDLSLELTNKCKVIIENYIRKYPDQWYMFRKFWIE